MAGLSRPTTPAKGPTPKPPTASSTQDQATAAAAAAGIPTPSGLSPAEIDAINAAFAGVVGYNPYGHDGRNNQQQLITDNPLIFTGQTDANGNPVLTPAAQAVIGQLNKTSYSGTFNPPGTVPPSRATQLGPTDQQTLRQTGAIGSGTTGATVTNDQVSAAIQHNGAAAPYMQAITTSAAKYGVPWQVLYAVLEHESNFDPTAVGVDPNDHGIAQINLPSHPDVSVAQANDPTFAIDFAAKYLSQGFGQYHDWGLAVAYYHNPASAAALSSPNTSSNATAAIATQYIAQVMGSSSKLSAADWGALGWDPGNDKNNPVTAQAGGILSGSAGNGSNLPISYRLIKPDPATLQVDARQMLGGLMFRTPSDGEVQQLVDYVNGVYDNVSAQLQSSAAAGTIPVPNSSSLVVQAAGTFLNTPSQFGGSGPSGIDCSALVQNAFNMLGVQLPRTTWDQVNTGTAVKDLSQAQPGDLVFFMGADSSGNGDSTPNGHVGIYVGNNQVLEADWGGQPVGVHQIDAAHKITAIRREDLPNDAAARFNAAVASGGGGGAANPTTNSGAAYGATGGAAGTSPGTQQSIDPETGYMTGPLRQKIDPQSELLMAIRQLPEYQALYGQKPGNLTEDAYAQHFLNMAQSLVGADYANTTGVEQAVRSGMEQNNPTTTAESLAVSSDAQNSPTFRGLMYQRALDFGRLAYEAPGTPASTGGA